MQQRISRLTTLLAISLHLCSCASYSVYSIGRGRAIAPNLTSVQEDGGMTVIAGEVSYPLSTARERVYFYSASPDRVQGSVSQITQDEAGLYKCEIGGKAVSRWSHIVFVNKGELKKYLKETALERKQSPSQQLVFEGRTCRPFMMGGEEWREKRKLWSYPVQVLMLPPAIALDVITSPIQFVVFTVLMSRWSH